MHPRSHDRRTDDDDRGPRPRPLPRPAPASSSAASAAAACSASSAASASRPWPAVRRRRLVGTGTASAVRPDPAGRAWRRAGGSGASPTSRSPRARSPRRPPGPTRATAPTGPTCSPSPASSAATSPASFGSASGVAEGVPLTMRLKVYDLDGEDATALAGAAVYLWHCDREGSYSMYAEGVADENYLRGVQEADADGRRRVHHDLPGGVLRALAARPLRGLPEPGRRRPAASNKLRTSQLAFPEDVCARGLRDRRLRAERRATCRRRQPRHRQRLQRRLLAADGQGHRVSATTGTSPR